jgi:hypothetical protein
MMPMASECDGDGGTRSGNDGCTRSGSGGGTRSGSGGGVVNLSVANRDYHVLAKQRRETFSDFTEWAITR